MTQARIINEWTVCAKSYSSHWSTVVTKLAKESWEKETTTLIWFLIYARNWIGQTSTHTHTHTDTYAHTLSLITQDLILSSNSSAFRKKVALKHPWNRTPHSLGQAGPQGPMFLSQDTAEAPSLKAGKRRLGSGPFVSPHPRTFQLPPQGPTFSAESQTPGGGTCSSARSRLSLLKAPYWRQVSMATWTRRLFLHTGNASSHPSTPWLFAWKQNIFPLQATNEKAY